jgi:phosphoglycolate phosphatase
MLFPESAIQKYPNLVNALEKGERKIIEEEGGEFYQGILDGIPKIARSFPLFIVSNCQQWYLDCFFKHSNLRPHFRDTDCHGKSNICKADMIRHMVLKHKLVNPIYVGDTLMDKDSSRMAQVEFGYADYGFGELGDEVLVFDSFTSLIAYFLPDRACNSDQ